MSCLRYLSHPQVRIDPVVPVPDWSLSQEGAARILQLAFQSRQILRDTACVISSPERRAIETATPVARALGRTVVVAPDSHEIDRSATGFLPPAEFEVVADAFFAEPDISTRGWECAIDAQERICASVETSLATAPPGDVLIVGHGGVGTLLFCAQAGFSIDQGHDQPPCGGNILEFDLNTRLPAGSCRPLEAL